MLYLEGVQALLVREGTVGSRDCWFSRVHKQQQQRLASDFEWQTLIRVSSSSLRAAGENSDWNLQAWLTRAGRQVKLTQSFRLETGFL